MAGYIWVTEPGSGSASRPRRLERWLTRQKAKVVVVAVGGLRPLQPVVIISCVSTSLPHSYDIASKTPKTQNRVWLMGDMRWKAFFYGSSSSHDTGSWRAAGCHGMCDACPDDTCVMSCVMRGHIPPGSCLLKCITVHNAVLFVVVCWRR